ncbi:TerB family tellurite resistance protein [Methylopila sp. M107]|uniref:TerB family tellurite resistance protein n=1 Tax=Methylopila sp. M107 TaxID=1101190 RepID=UPI000373C205|nr:TerB family tellurite resistance protein [Methylopila sp. M107]
MHLLVLLITIAAAAIFFVVRARRAVQEAKRLHRETKPLQHRAKDAVTAMIGTPLGRIREPDLAAAALMIQLVRSEGAMTAEEKETILARLADPIGAADPQALFEQAWRMTAQEAFFSLVSDEVTPMLKERLTPPQQADLIEMLRQVAALRDGPSELQRSSIARFAKRLTGAPAAFTRP